MDATVALADTMIARSSLVPGVEVIVAGPAQLRFPPRLSGMLGICVKSGPSHLVKADSRDRWYPAGGVCIRPPGCVWETTTERNGFVSIDLPVAFFPEGSFAGSMSFAPRGALPDLGLKAQRLLAADSELLAEQLIVELVTGVQEIGGVELRVAGGHRGSIHRAREFIDAMFTARVTLEDIAAEAGFNKFWLVRLFRSTFGTTPHAYLLMLRVNRARQLLAEGSRPVDVALEVGFADQAHLTRWFGRAFGVSPTTYARQARKPPPGQFCSRRE